MDDLRVQQRWYEDIAAIEFNYCEVDADTVEAHCAATPDARKITFSDSIGLTDSLLYRVTEICGRTIRKLNLAHCDDITPAGIEKALSQCPALEHLNLKDCVFRPSDVLNRQLFQKFPSLTTIKLPNGIKIERPVDDENNNSRGKLVDALLSGRIDKLTFGTSLTEPETRRGDQRYQIDFLPTQHKSGVWDLNTTQDGRLLSASYDRRVGLWNVGPANSGVKFFNKNKRAALCVTDLGNGLIGLGDHGGKWRVWDYINDGYAELSGHPYGVYSLIKINEKLVATGSCDMVKGARTWEYVIKIWSYPECKAIHTLHGHQGAIPAMTVLSAPAGPVLVTASADRTVRVWNIKDWTCQRTLNTHRDYIYTLCKIDNRHVATGSRDKEIHVLDVSNGLRICQLQGHSSTVYSVTFLGNDHLASASRDTTIRIWNLTSGSAIKVIEDAQQIVYSLASLPGQLFAGLEKGQILRVKFDANWMGDKHYLALGVDCGEIEARLSDFYELRVVNIDGGNRENAARAIDSLVKYQSQTLRIVSLVNWGFIATNDLKKLIVNCPNLRSLSLKGSTMEDTNEETQMLLNFMVHNSLTLSSVISSRGEVLEKPVFHSVDASSLTSSSDSVNSRAEREWRYF